ncbi:tetratricopeptide repeat protein [Humitalea sp. 24SJ18S-53]|uniref:tetratricopeptide repeat protein n=1 Tax=Humitalea sp. 24SJ18S-53 TaxID=3422307 RepID=UPI003D67D56E
MTYALPDIFDEVAEDLRAERASRFWRRYGTLVGAFGIAVVIGVGAWQGWRWNERRQAEGVAGTFLAVHQAAEAEGADMAEMARRFGAIAPGAPAGYRLLSELRQAALLSESGDKARAREIWNHVAADATADPLWRNLANLLWVLHGLDIDPPAALDARLTPLAADGSPWKASARELQALVALRAGQTAAARSTLLALAADPSAPQGVRDRAQRVAAQIAVAAPGGAVPAVAQPGQAPAAIPPAPAAAMTPPVAVPAATLPDPAPAVVLPDAAPAVVRPDPAPAVVPPAPATTSADPAPATTSADPAPAATQADPAAAATPADPATASPDPVPAASPPSPPPAASGG